MEATEAKVMSDEIEKELDKELSDVRMDDSPKVETIEPVKSVLNVGPSYVKLFCRVENALLFRVATRDVSQDAKERLRPLAKTSDEEVKLTKTAIDYYGTDNLSPEMIKLINEYSNSPLAPLIQFKIDQYNVIRAQAKIEARNPSKGE